MTEQSKTALENRAYDLKALTEAVESYPPFHYILQHHVVRRALKTAREQYGRLTVEYAYDCLSEALDKAREKAPPVKVLLYDNRNSSANDIRWTLDGKLPIVNLVFDEFRLAGYSGLELSFTVDTRKYMIQVATKDPGRLFTLIDLTDEDTLSAHERDRHGLILPADHFLWRRIYVP